MPVILVMHCIINLKIKTNLSFLNYELEIQRISNLQNGTLLMHFHLRKDQLHASQLKWIINLEYTSAMSVLSANENIFEKKPFMYVV